jgi:hypothetical protein
MIFYCVSCLKLTIVDIIIHNLSILWLNSIHQLFNKIFTIITQYKTEYLYLLFHYLMNILIFVESLRIQIWEISHVVPNQLQLNLKSKLSTQKIIIPVKNIILLILIPHLLLIVKHKIFSKNNRKLLKKLITLSITSLKGNLRCLQFKNFLRIQNNAVNKKPL